MTDLLIDPSEPATSGTGTADLTDAIIRPAVVYAVPSSQVYYWSEAWQSGERESVEALRNGQGIRFSSGTELAAWLLSDDEGEDLDQHGD